MFGDSMEVWRSEWCGKGRFLCTNYEDRCEENNNSVLGTGLLQEDPDPLGQDQGPAESIPTF